MNRSVFHQPRSSRRQEAHWQPGDQSLVTRLRPTGYGGQASAAIRGGATRRWARGFVAVTVSLLAVLPTPVWACAACFGKSDDAMARAMNMGIFSLLVVVLFVLGGIGAFAIFLMRRAAQFPSLPLSEEPAVEPGAAPGPMPEALSALSQPSQ